MNKLEKIFSLIIKFNDSDERVQSMSKLLQGLNARLQNVLQTIREIGAATGIKEATDTLKVYDTAVKEADTTRKKATNTAQREKEQTEAVAKVQATLLRECKNLVFTKKEAATISKNFIALQNSEKQSVNALTAQINILNVAWKKMGGEQQKSVAYKQVTANLKALREELRSLTMSAGDNSRNIGNYASALYGAVSSTLTAIASIAYTVKRVLTTIFQPFQDLEYRMSMVRAVTRATEAELIALERNDRDLGATTEYTATEVAGLQLAYARMGFVPDQIIKITGATLDLATATGENLAKSADVVGTTLRGFNLEADQTQRVVDVMTQAFNTSSLQLDSFYEAMKYVAPIASVANVSLEQTSAMLGVLADRGIRGSQAGTALRRIFTEMAKEGGSVSERLDQLSKTGLTLGGAMDEVGRYAMTALTVLSKSKDSVDEMTVALDNSAGAAKKAADIMRDNMKGDADKFLSAVREKLIAIGEYLSPLARAVMQFGTAFVTNLKQIALALGVGAAAIALFNIRLKLKIALTQLSVLHGKASAIVTALETAALSGNTVALIRNAMATKEASALTKIYAVAKLLLTGNVKAATAAIKVFTQAIAKNPLGLLAVALASVVSYFVFFRKEADAATRAQQRFNDEQERFNKAQDEKRQRIEALIGVIRNENETEEAKIRAYQQLQTLSPALAAKYTQEQLATIALADSTRALNEQRDKENYDRLVSDVEKYTASLKKLREEDGKTVYSNQGVAGSSYIIDNSKQIAAQEAEIEKYKAAIKEIETARQQAEENNKPIKLRIEVAEGNVERMKTELTKLQGLRDAWIKEHGNLFPMPIDLRMDLSFAEKSLTDEQKKLEDLRKKKNTVPVGGKDNDKEKWSLSEDKEHNRQLLALKQQLYSGEIATEEIYQKQVLQLEIDTLTRRIALNKDNAKAILKIKEELADKQHQQHKNAKKEEEEYTAFRKTQADAVAQDDFAHREAEVQQMAESTDKKIRLNNLSTEKAKIAAQREYNASIEALTQKQQAYKDDPAKVEAIEAEKMMLTARYTQKTSDISLAGANARVKILRDATEEELKEYGKLPNTAAIAEAAITENKKREVEKRLKLSKQELIGADDKFVVNEAVADATYGTDPKDKDRHAARLKNELELRQAKAQTYLADLAAMQQNGQTESAAYQETLKNLSIVKQEVGNLGKGMNADGSGGGVGGWMMRTFKLGPEQIEQLKQQAWDLASQLSDAIIGAQKQASQRRLNNEKKSIDAEYKIHSKLLDDKRDKGLISEKTYQKEMEKLEAQKAAKEEEAERAAFEREKKLNIKQALINTAMSVAKTFAMWGWPLGIPFAAMAVAQGAIQVAMISSQKYAQGGLIPLGEGVGVVKGRSHAQGGHQIYLDGRPIGEIEGDELLAIVNKHDTARIGALSAANSVHGRKFAQGGLLSPRGYRTTSVAPPAGFAALAARQAEAVEMMEARQNTVVTAIREEAQQQIEAINRRIDTLRVVVVAQEVTDTQDNIKKITVKSSW